MATSPNWHYRKEIEMTALMLTKLGVPFVLSTGIPESTESFVLFNKAMSRQDVDRCLDAVNTARKEKKLP